jgi:ADP-heptose:LPS heptosyltransferase
LYKKILIYKTGSLGDLIVSLPALNRIKEKHLNDNIYLLSNKNESDNILNAKEIFNESAIFKKILLYDITNLRKCIAQLRSLRINELYYIPSKKNLFQLTRDFIFFKFICNIKKVNYFPWSYKKRINKFDNNIEEREYNRLLRSLEIKPINEFKSKDWDFRYNLEKLKKLDTLKLNNSKYIIVNTGGKNFEEKNIGLNNWLYILNLLINIFKIKIIFIGNKKDFDYVEKLKLNLDSKYIKNLCGNLNFLQLYLIIKNSNLFIGHDSGPMHLAYSNHVPCLVFFGRYNNPEKWYPCGNNHLIFHERKKKLKLVNLKKNNEKILNYLYKYL